MVYEPGLADFKRLAESGPPPAAPASASTEDADTGEADSLVVNDDSAH